jgi:hypothetical protein
MSMRRVAAAILLLCAGLFDMGSAWAQSQTPIARAERFSGNINFVATGGSLRTQPNTGDACALAPTSTATLSGIPAGTSVVAAFLYWGASTTGGATPVVDAEATPAVPVVAAVIELPAPAQMLATEIAATASAPAESEAKVEVVIERVAVVEPVAEVVHASPAPAVLVTTPAPVETAVEVAAPAAVEVAAMPAVEVSIEPTLAKPAAVVAEPTAADEVHASPMEDVAAQPAAEPRQERLI